MRPVNPRAAFGALFSTALAACLPGCGGPAVEVSGLEALGPAGARYDSAPQEDPLLRRVRELARSAPRRPVRGEEPRPALEERNKEKAAPSPAPALPEASGSPRTETREGPLRAPARAPEEPASRGHLFGPGDVMHVVVGGRPEFTGELVVRDDGTVALPATGDLIEAGGLTAGEISEKVAAALFPKYLKARPSVSVQLVRSPRMYYHVFGEVARPGRYDLPPGGLSILDALLIALGVRPLEEGRKGLPGADDALKTTHARLEMVHVFTEGEAEAEVIDLPRAMLGDPSGKKPVRPGQILVVPGRRGPWSPKALQETLSRGMRSSGEQAAPLGRRAGKGGLK